MQQENEKLKREGENETKEHKAATIIQARYRGIKAREDALHKLLAVVTIQRFARMVVPRMEFLLNRELSVYDCFEHRLVRII